MTRAVTPRPTSNPAFTRPREVESLQPSPQERASGMVVALLVLLGMVVLVMLGLWLSSSVSRPMPAKVEFAKPAGREAGGSPGAERPLEEVIVDAETIMQEVRIEETLQAVSGAVAAQASTIDALGTGTGGKGNGEDQGVGEHRGPGPDGPTAAKLPQWEVRFNASTLEQYAAQLDFFGIELGVVGGGKPTVDYAARLSQPEPVTRTAPGSEEQRRYLVWRKGPLAAADRSLLEKAKVETTGRIILQFLPAELESQLSALELTYARVRPLDTIRRTVFGVTGSAGQYEFVVLEQEIR